MIKSLNTMLKLDKEKYEVPKSVQDMIPIRRIWPDGIFQVGNKFSKSIRFSDKMCIRDRSGTVRL